MVPVDYGVGPFGARSADSGICSSDQEPAPHDGDCPRAEKDSGIISINGAAAHKASPGDKLIIATYADYNESELETYRPTLVYLDESNKMTITKNSIAIQAA